jgi:hypothetical protein
MIKFFEVVNNNLVFLRDEVLMIKEFKAVWARNKIMEGDHDGRKKRLNQLEFMYIQKMADVLLGSNIYAGFSDKDKDAKIREDLGMPKGWNPDDTVRAAIVKWSQIQATYSPSVYILKNMLQGLMLSGSAIETINKQLNSLIETNNNMISDNMTVEDVVLATENSRAIVALIGDVLKLGKDVPKTISELQSFEASITKEIGAKSEVIKSGGRKVGLFEDPN